MNDTTTIEAGRAPATLEERIASRIDTGIAGGLQVSSQAGGVAFANAGQALEFAKMMAIGGVAIPKHLRGNPGACLAVVIQAIEWKLSPFAVANKSYSVNDRLAYESQLIQAVILQRAPIRGRFKVEYRGEGDQRICRVWAELQDGGEIVDYESPPFGKITPKNSPLWKSDPDQQHFYYSGRALCRRHFPDVLLGVYARDEVEDVAGDPEQARDITPPPKSLAGKLDMLASAPAMPAHDADTGEIIEDPGGNRRPADGDGGNAAELSATAAPSISQERDEHSVKPSAETASPGQADDEPAVPAQLSADDRRKLRLLADALGSVNTPAAVEKGASRFWNDHGLGDDDVSPLAVAATEIVRAQSARTRGEMSVAEADAAVRRVLPL